MWSDEVEKEYKCGNGLEIMIF